MTESEPLPFPVAVVGPTASGKSALGIALAQRFSGEIVNVDSMQLYRGMDIGTAKLSVDEREGIPHHQLDKLDVTERASVAVYQQSAIQDIEAIRARGKTPILVGGSMLYVQSLVDDWQFPPTDVQVRARWQRRLNEVGMRQLHRELAAIDPEAAAIIEDNDPRRTVRALEVIELTGQPFTASQPPIDAPARWGTLILGLATAPEWLNPRVEARTRMMFRRGLVDEVESLITEGLVAESTAGRAIGYSQVLAMLRGTLTYDDAIEKTITGTRRYIRRQRSWFRRDPRTQWIDAADDTLTEAMSIIDSYARVYHPADHA
ncbi:tRNA (adenosine(37)-N6)-dimethylallyltransferase MiaA [Corynebacterium kroppenstedtii]|uniref:tRNA (adenosine(37)-N6)-dimethylallyltransferase MiaA n=1 Tax=Corynebacterium sp. PCR 32 TaxID=3351342 RepID=UPI0037526C1E